LLQPGYIIISMENKIIGRFSEKPRIRLNWWTCGLGLAAVLIGPVTGFVSWVIESIMNPVHAQPKSVTSAPGFTGGTFGLILALAAIALFIMSWKKGERSWALWVGLVPAALMVAYWVFILTAMLVVSPH
jgi:hypothetical protein